MKRLKMIGWIAVLLLGIVACKKEPIAGWKQTGNIKVVYPEGIDILEMTGDSLYFTNRSTGRQTIIEFGATIELENGLYDCAFRAEVDYKSDGSVNHGVIYGLTTSVEILDEAPTFTIETHLLESKGDFLIEEIFFTGTLYPTGKQYHGDSYIKIFMATAISKSIILPTGCFMPTALPFWSQNSFLLSNGTTSRISDRTL